MDNKLVLVGDETDPHIASAAVNLAGVSHRLTLSGLATSEWSVEQRGSDCQLVINGEVVGSGSQTVVWWRKPRYQNLIEHLDGWQYRFAEAEWKAALAAIAVALRQCTWIDELARIESADGKVRQLTAASRVGLDVPTWMVGNARPRQIDSVVKRLSSQFVELPRGLDVRTSRLREDLVGGSLWRTGVNFVQQEIAASHDVRVVVVAKEVFGWQAERAHGEVDFRAVPTAELEWRRVQLSTSEVSLLQALGDELGLVVFVVDLLRLVNGSLVFLEVNCRGNFKWIDEQCGDHADAALNRFLASQTEAAH